MRVPVLTALTDADWEADLVAALDHAELPVAVVRRCVDLTDLLAAAASGTARAVLLSADLRRLDRGALARLAAAQLAVVGLVTPGDPAAQQRLHQLGVTHVLPADAGTDAIATAVVAAVERARGAAGQSGELPPTVADLRTALPDLADLADAGDAADAGDSAVAGDADSGDLAGRPAAGGVVAVWGPTGAPGRTTTAVGVADELARLGRSTLLVDADVYGGVVAQVLGLLDEAPGLAAATRAANTGTLDHESLARLCRTLPSSLRVLTGIRRADRWAELRPGSVEVVLDAARAAAEATVLDCSFALEQDEELAYDTAAPRRNGTTLTALAAADTVLAVGSADPVGIQRLVAGLGELRDAVPGVEPVVVVNRVRRRVAGSRGSAPEREIRAALTRYADVQDPVLIPFDLDACDAALAAGRTVAEVAPRSAARLALAGLAARLVGAAPPRTRRRRRLLPLRGARDERFGLGTDAAASG